MGRKGLIYSLSNLEFQCEGREIVLIVKNIHALRKILTFFSEQQYAFA